MADPTGKYKVRELDPYVQLDSTDPLYVDPSSVVVLVDSSNENWGSPLPKTLRLEELVQIGNTASYGGDSGIITNPATKSVTIAFAATYPRIPVGRSNLYVYRVVDEGGTNYDQQVKITNLVITTAQCTFTIADDEDLEGVTIEYNFK